RAVSELPGNWRLRIVGDGPYRPALEALAKTLGIEGRVSFEPSIPSGEMPYFLNSLDVLVLPSLTRRNWKEQFGRVLVEAMACEVPVIGSSSGEIPHLIAEAGLVFPEGHIEALREALLQLMCNAELRAELGQRGRARVLAHYTQQRVAAETYAIYQQMLASP
ncbi:MAG: glycosyltransferase, partial [Anaerolineae bacterium]